MLREQLKKLRKKVRRETKLDIGKLAKIIGAVLPAEIDPNMKFDRILTQSEYVQPGDVVISAGWYPADKVIKDSLKQGALLVFCAEEHKANYPQSNVIGVRDPLKCVQSYEKWKCARIPAKRITITGSVGKTTTTGLINKVISDHYKTFVGNSMSNSHGAILRNIQKLTHRYEYWVQEVGGVMPGYVESSACVIRPDIVVLTNIGESHLNTYQTQQNIFIDKSSLERYAKRRGAVVICYDDDILRNAKYKHKVITCSMNNSKADYYAKNIHTTMEGICFTAVCPDGEYETKLRLYGEYNVYNALFAIAVGRLSHVPMQNILKSISEYQPSGMRQNYVNIGGYSMMIDVFNAEPKTVLGSAVTLTQMPKPKGKKIFITGHIDKLGDDSVRMHEKLGHDLAKLDLDQVIFYAGDSKYTYKAMVDDGCTNALLMDTREDLDNWVRENVTRDDIVFFKSGQFEAALVKTIDHVFGTNLQNEQQYNNGTLVEKDGYAIRLRKDNIAEIEKYTGEETNLVLPADYEGVPVLRIRPFAFSKNQQIRSVVIPDSVNYIGQEAFYQCTSLQTVKLPKNLKIIGKNAFNYNKSLSEVDIPEGTIHIDRHAFFDCIGLQKITIPDSVGYLGDDVIGCSKHLHNDPTVCVGNSEYVQHYLTEHHAKFETVTE